MSGMVKREIPKVIILLLPLFFLTSCSTNQALSIFFDIPPKPKVKVVAKEDKKPTVKKEGESQEQTGPEGEKSATYPARKRKEERPPIEKAIVWEEAEKMLPKDDSGEVDWMEAIRQGIIKPRGSIDGSGEPFVFKFNFHFPGPSGLLGAYFPHSAHTQWLTCESCHPVIFPQRGTKLSMAKILSGEFCGKCHTKVAFPIAKGCKRCHTKKS